MKEQKEQQARDKVLKADEESDWLIMATERPYEDVKIEKTWVIEAFTQDGGDISMNRFSGARNWRSVKRWWKKIEKGESP